MPCTKGVMKGSLGGRRMVVLLGAMNEGGCRGGGGYQRLLGHRAWGRRSCGRRREREE